MVKKQYPHWWCECSCLDRTIKHIQYSSLVTNVTTSCGCYNSESTRKTMTTHGLTKTSEYRSFLMAQTRCNNSEFQDYKWYGGRGIEFRFNSITELINDIGMKPKPKSKYSLDRIDVNGHYEIGNVQWLDDSLQNRNKRNNYLITYNNETKCVAEWSEIVGIRHATIMTRINIYNWCDVCSITIPAHRKGQLRLKCLHKEMLND